MFREYCTLIQVKTTTEDVLNCWLSYIVSQPVSFDLQILLIFFLEYIGALSAIALFTSTISEKNNRTGRDAFSCVEFHSDANGADQCTVCAKNLCETAMHPGH